MKELVKQLPVLKKRQLTLKQSNCQSTSFGNKGEELASAFLVKNGYTILNRNLRLKSCEVDIIALDTKYHEVVFLEVKRRKTAFFGSPTRAVSQKKIRNMHRVATVFLKKHSYPCDYRFDIISIVDTKIEHFKNITWLT